MTAPEATDVARQIARMCRASADELAGLQGTLLDELQIECLTDRVIVDLQRLDAIQQTLDDLGAILAMVSPVPQDLIADCTRGAKQQWLRQRLRRTAHDAENGMPGFDF